VVGVLAFLGCLLFLLAKNGVILPKGVQYMDLVIACVAALAVSIVVVYDLKRIVNREHRIAVSPEESVLAAMALYIDILLMFPVILILLATRGRWGDCQDGSGGGGTYHDRGVSLWVCCWDEGNGREEEQRRDSYPV